MGYSLRYLQENLLCLKDDDDYIPDDWEDDFDDDYYDYGGNDIKLQAKKGGKKQAPKPEPKKPAPKKETKVTTKKETKTVDEATEKLRKQKLVEEADFKNTSDLFGNLEEFVNLQNPKDAKDFEGLASHISSSLKKYQSNQNYTTFVVSLLKNLTEKMNSKQLEEIEKGIKQIKEKGKDAFGGAGLKAVEKHDSDEDDGYDFM